MNQKSTKSKKSKKQPKQNRWQLSAGLAFILIGLIVGGISLFNVWQGQRSTTKPQPLSKVLSHEKSQKASPSNDQSLISGTPVRIRVPSVNIDLNVIPGYYYPATKSWTLSLNNAQYAVMTAKANNQQGDTFIYAHARYGVFHDLPKILPGAETIITTDNGHTFTYKFQSSSITTPDDTTLFDYKGKPVLILQTCTGTYFQNRQLFVFNLAKVS
ncbi:sortase [Candidatus Saccharibacteria bacterium]|nr:sortase [Candidatus Saccharibacteria bacterium]